MLYHIRPVYKAAAWNQPNEAITAKTTLQLHFSKHVRRGGDQLQLPAYHTSTLSYMDRCREAKRTVPQVKEKQEFC